MTHSSGRHNTATPRLPGRWIIVVGTLISSVAWLVAAAGLIGVVSFLPVMGWPQVASLVALCGGPQGALWAARHVRQSRRVLAAVTEPMLEQRLHGTLDAISDSQCRTLRPIGMAAGDVAARTGSRLAELIEIPSVRIFHGVRAPGCPAPPIAHVVAAGRTLILVESVAWPAGRYAIDASGRVNCDGRYIGQSVQPLVEAVQHWRTLLPRNHRVSALVVVHTAPDGRYTLPVDVGTDLTWVRIDDVFDHLAARVSHHRHVSTHSIAALVAATPSH
jgi:hypothetical protein